MSTVVCRIRPSINAAYQKPTPLLGVTRKAVYDKLDRLEPGVAAALVRHTAPPSGRSSRPWAGDSRPGCRAIASRSSTATTWPGPSTGSRSCGPSGPGPCRGTPWSSSTRQLMLVTDVVPCEDGHAQERSLLDRVLGLGPARGPLDRRPQLLHDRLPLRDRPPPGVLRDPPARRRPCPGSSSASGGRAAGSRPGRSSSRRSGCEHEDGEVLVLRRITVRPGPADPGRRHRDPHPDQPAGRGRPGQDDRRVVPQAVDDRDGLRRTGGDAVRGEINTLGYPKAALFAFCVALVSYNVLSVVKAALRSVHGAKVVTEEVSGYYLADEVAGTHRGMMIAIPEEDDGRCSRPSTTRAWLASSRRSPVG